MKELPYELRLALGKIINHETSCDYEIQEIIFTLYKYEKLTWHDLKQKTTIPSVSEGDLQEAIMGLWVVGFLEWDDGGKNMRKVYELSPFGRRLLKNLLDTLFIVEEEES